jgi:hypothetical protein
VAAQLVASRVVLSSIELIKGANGMANLASLLHSLNPPQNKSDVEE